MPTSARHQLRIVIVRDPRTREWTARFEDDPGTRYQSASPETALTGLLRRNLNRLPANYGVKEVSSDYWKGRVEAVVFARTPCPDCGGSGKYVGLIVIEACRTCDGQGVIHA